MEHLLIEYRRV